MLKTPAKEVWGLVEQLRADCEVSRLIASSEDESVAIYLEVPRNKVNAYINVTEYGTNVFFEIVMDESDCIDSVERIYSLYLDDEEPDDNIPVSEDMKLERELDDRECEIEDREYNMLEAAEEFLAVMLEGADKANAIEPRDLAAKIVDAVAKSLYRKGVDVYRPMYLEDEKTGEIEYFEFPYSQLS